MWYPSENTNLRQHRTIRQADSVRDFSPGQGLKSAGILCVFQAFQTAELVEKIQRSAKAQLCGVAIVLLHGGLSLSFICVHRLAWSNQHIHKIFKHVRPRKILFFLKSSANSMVSLGRCRHRPLRVVSGVFFQLPTSPDSGSHHAFSDTP